MQRVATNDPCVAAERAGKIQGKLQEPEKQRAWSQIGLNAAKRHIPDAVAWYAKGRRRFPTTVSMEGAGGAARPGMGRRAGDHRSRCRPPVALPEWTYWLGRAHKAGGAPPTPRP